MKKDIRTNQAHQVIQYSNQGKSIVEDCQEVGISRSTFYYLTSRNPDAIASFQEMQLVAAVRQFKLILDNQIEILRRVIEEALAETTRPRQRLAIKKYLNDVGDDVPEPMLAGPSGLLSLEATPGALRAAVLAVLEGLSVSDRPAAVAGSWRAATGIGHEPLTSRELEVFELMSKGLSNKEIAMALGISHRTVQKHLQRIYQHLGVQTRAEAIVRRQRETLEGAVDTDA